MIINAYPQETSDMTFLETSVLGRDWLCATPEHLGQRSLAPVMGGLKGQVRPEAGTAVRSDRSAVRGTDVFVPATGIPAWSPPI